MAINEEIHQIAADPVPFARSYQLEVLEIALRQNTIVFFETGTGKTLIAIMLLRSYAHLLRKPLPYIAVFLAPTVDLVNQQGESIKTHTDLEVGKYSGDMGVDFWDAATWKRETDKHEVLVMTPQILLDALRHRFIRLDQIKVLIFDECHIARGKSNYACIMTEFYHRELESGSQLLPRVFGMTASPIKAKASNSNEAYWKKINELENLMHSKVFTCHSDSILSQYINFSTPKLKMYDHEDLPHETFNSLESSLQELVEKKQGVKADPKEKDYMSKPTVPLTPNPRVQAPAPAQPPLTFSEFLVQQEEFLTQAVALFQTQLQLVRSARSSLPPGPKKGEKHRGKEKVNVPVPEPEKDHAPVPDPEAKDGGMDEGGAKADDTDQVLGGLEGLVDQVVQEIIGQTEDVAK